VCYKYSTVIRECSFQLLNPVAHSSCSFQLLIPTAHSSFSFHVACEELNHNIVDLPQASTFNSPLSHQSMAGCDIELQRSLIESFWQSAVMRIVEVIVELEAYTKHRVCYFITLLPYFEQ
jgi:hypothetical protein